MYELIGRLLGGWMWKALTQARHVENDCKPHFVVAGLWPFKQKSIAKTTITYTPRMLNSSILSKTPIRFSTFLVDALCEASRIVAICKERTQSQVAHIACDIAGEFVAVDRHDPQTRHLTQRSAGKLAGQIIAVQK